MDNPSIAGFRSKSIKLARPIWDYMDHQSLIKILNATGQSINFVGGFLLTVEAIRVARITSLAQTLEELSNLVTSSANRREPLPLRWYFALGCAIFIGLVWGFAPYLLLFTLTPTLFIVVFILHRFLSWSIKLSTTGYVGVVGFGFVTVGSAFQLLIATLM